MGQDTGLGSDKSAPGLVAAGFISLSDWAEAVESVLRLGLPWRMLRPQLVSSSADSTLEYKSWLKDLAKEQRSREVMVGRRCAPPYCGPRSSLWGTLKRQQVRRTQKRRWMRKGNSLLSFWMSGFVLSDLHMLPQFILKIPTSRGWSYQHHFTYKDAAHRAARL